MKAVYRWVVILMAIGQCVRAGDAVASKREPGYEGKPVAYWMGELRTFSEKKLSAGRASSDTDLNRAKLLQAFEGVGLNGVPDILAWDWRGRDGEVDNGGPAYVNFALKCLTDHDKESLLPTLDRIGKETKDPQVLASVIAACPHPVSNPLLQKPVPERDKRITLALEVRQMLGTNCKWKEPMAGSKKAAGTPTPSRPATNSVAPRR